jgi:hypothetical protein
LVAEIFEIIKIVRFYDFDIFQEIFEAYDRATLITHRYEDLKSIGVNLADISQYIKIEKIENLRYFSQAR